MSEFLQRVETQIQSRQLFSRAQKILVAVSGGVDSMVLLHALNSLAQKNGWKIFVAHFNHQLRGRASDADEKLVRHTAKKMRLPVFVESADVKKFSVQEKISIEMAARKLRHEFFARVARTNKIKVVALAQHADDQVELFFLRLLRGAGGEGLAGMKPLSPSPADKKISLVRPLLESSKPEILEFARANRIQFRDDATNFSNDFLRNRIRNELLPLLKTYQPQITKTVLRAMEITGAESEFVSQMAAQGSAPKVLFGKLPVAIQRKVLQRGLLESGIAADFELIEQLRILPGKFASVSATLSVARNETGKILRRGLSESKFRRDELPLSLNQRPAGEFGGKRFGWKFLRQVKFAVPPGKPGSEIFDADKVGAQITLRHWRAGDRFQPIGLKSPAKLQDLFVNAKIPAARRRNLVLAEAVSGEIFWVEGLRISENFKLTRDTKRRLVWNWLNLPA